MRVTVITGELQTHLEIKQRILQALNRHDFQLIVLFPTLSLLNAVQNELLNLPEISGIGGIRLLLFEGFIAEIANRFGLNQARPSRLQRELFVTQAFHYLQSRGKLEYLTRAPFNAAYRQAILGGIAEWKRSSLSPALMAEWAGSKGAKEQELAMLYQLYQTLLQTKGLVEEDLILKQLEELSGDFTADHLEARVLLYGFTDLTPLQMDFIKVLKVWFEFEAIIDPTIVSEFQTLTAGHFYFKPFKPVQNIEPKSNLQRLQKFFWSAKPQRFEIENDDHSLELLRIAGQNRQAEGVARAIMKLWRADSSLNVNSFLIFAPQPSQFLKTALPIFQEYRIPISEPERVVSEFPGVNRFLQSLMAASNDWRWSDMELLIRQYYAGSQVEYGDQLILVLGERYGSLSGRIRWLNLVYDPAFREYFGELNLELTPLLTGLIWLEQLPLETSLEAYLQLAAEWFNSEAARSMQRLATTPEVLKEQLQNYRAVQLLSETLKELLEHGEELPGFCENLTLLEFQRFCQDYLLSLELPPLPESLPGIKVLPLREARGLTAPYVFMVGLEQGVCPRSYVSDWKLSHLDRCELKSLGIELETSEQYKIQEKLAFYWTIQTATERLYLVAREQNNAGQPLSRSAFLDEILRWFPDLWDRALKYGLAPEPPLDFASCYGSSELRKRWASYLVTPLTELSVSERAMAEELLLEPEYLQMGWRIYQYQERQHRFFESFLSSAAENLLEFLVGEQRILSLTALEDYQRCPYQFFFKHLLKVRALIKPELRPGGRDLGNLYHQVLQEFGENYRGDILYRADELKYQQILRGVFEKYFQQWQEQAANDLDRLILKFQEEQIWQNLVRWLKQELEWSEKNGSRFYFRYLEFAFGNKCGEFDPESVFEPYEFELQGRMIRLSGKIDRVDMDEQGNFVVYDYKLGRGTTRNDLLKLEQLQIPAYLLALEQLGVAMGQGVGGCYLGMKHRAAREENGVWHETRFTTVKGIITATEWDQWLSGTKELLAELVLRIRQGKFHPQLEQCFDYCEYQDCCRKKEWEAVVAHEQEAE